MSQIRAEALVLLRDALNHALDPELVTPHARPDGCAAQRRDAYFAAVAARHAASMRLARGRTLTRRSDRPERSTPAPRLRPAPTEAGPGEFCADFLNQAPPGR